MEASTVFWFGFLAIISLTNGDEPCNFAQGCTCHEEFIPLTVDVNCVNVSIIPKFTNATPYKIFRMEIIGNFTEIPVKAFSALDTDITMLVFYRSEERNATLTIPEGAFTTNQKIRSISFNDFAGLTTVPPTFGETNGLSSIEFFNCGITSIRNDTFKGVNLITLGIYESYLSDVEDDAFNGVEGTLMHLFLTDNKLERIPEAIKSLTNITLISMDGNNITDVPDDAFPSSVESIVLSRNPMLSVNDNSFRGLTELYRLELNSCGLTSIPTFTDMSLQKLQILQLRNNQIKTISNDAFPFVNMTSMPDLDNNPIEDIDKNAFSGLSSVISVGFTNLYELKSIDFEIFSNMEKLHDVTFKDCHKLENVNFSSPENAPPELTLITISNSDRIYDLYFNFGFWLKAHSERILDVSDNGFVCTENLQWMNEYVFCSFHPQIRIEDSKCDETQIPLEGYLKHLDRECE